MADLLALDVGLFTPRCGDVTAWSEQIIYELLEMLTRLNQRVLACGQIPPLYLSGVRWVAQPPLVVRGPDGERVRILERFKTIPQILAKGVADCDQLAPWRMAELRAMGVPARFWLQRYDRPEGPLYHVVIIHPVPGGWLIEDPSRELGMPTTTRRAA